MNITAKKFVNDSNNEFFHVLRKRVSDHFEKNNISKYGNWNMRIKSVLMLSVFYVPYFILIFGEISNPVLIILLYLIIGVGMAGIGLSVMHDANHGSYSSKKWVNKYMGYTMNLIGANAEIWKLQHNRLHHTYTNIEGADDDINTPMILRFSPHRKKYWIHKYQFLYVWFFYGISTLSWITMKEFVQLFRYRKIGLIPSKKRFRFMLAQLTLWKLFYYGYMIVIPFVFISAPIWLLILSFVLMHFTTGLILSLIFQTAHVMPQCNYPQADENGTIENNWAIHEMMTTSNYSPKSNFFSWCIGGLNYQIEHHLFPNVCHVHYKRISKIVAETAKEFGVPYYSEKNFMAALIGHTKMLYKLGRVEYKPATQLVYN